MVTEAEPEAPKPTLNEQAMATVNRNIAKAQKTVAVVEKSARSNLVPLVLIAAVTVDALNGSLAAALVAGGITAVAVLHERT